MILTCPYAVYARMTMYHMNRSSCIPPNVPTKWLLKSKYLQSHCFFEIICCHTIYIPRIEIQTLPHIMVKCWVILPKSHWGLFHNPIEESLSKPTRIQWNDRGIPLLDASIGLLYWFIFLYCTN